jgi:hypothetical protein
MRWYKVKDKNVYLGYITSKSTGLWIYYDSTLERINQIELTAKLYNEDDVKASKDYIKPSTEVINKIWKHIIHHPNWDKMLIRRVFNI